MTNVLLRLQSPSFNRCEIFLIGRQWTRKNTVTAAILKIGLKNMATGKD